MLLAELEVFQSRPIAPTRRVALGQSDLPVEPAPGFGGLLLGAVAAGFVEDIDDDLHPDLVRLSHQVEQGLRIPQPRLRHRFQVDHIGLNRRTHRLFGDGEQAKVLLDRTDGTAAAPQVLAAIYAAGNLDLGTRGPVMELIRRGLRWRGPIDDGLVEYLTGGTARGGWVAVGTGDPVLWALGVLGLPGMGAEQAPRCSRRSVITAPSGPPRPRRAPATKRSQADRRSHRGPPHPARRLMAGGALLLTPGAGSDRNHPTLVGIEAAVAPLPVARIDFPYRREGRKAPDRAPKLIACVVEEAAALVASAGVDPGSLVLGGRSMGGRMCSLAVAEGLPARALVLLSYPLHPPGKPDNLRVDHFGSLDLPCLFVSGTRDPFGTPAEFAEHLPAIPGPVTPVWIEGAGHDVKDIKSVPRQQQVVEAVTTWLAAL